MKQIGIGVMQYLQDYDERYPLGTYQYNSDGNVPQTDSSLPGARFLVCTGSSNSCTSATQGNYITWMDLIYPYVKSTNLFVCPSNVQNTAAPNGIPSYGYSVAFSNLYSRATNFNAGVSYSRGGIAMAAISYPSRTIMIAEIQSKYAAKMKPSDVVAYSNSANAAARHYVAPHLDGGVAAYADGHAKWRSIAKMKTPSGGTACNLSSIDENSAYCSYDWNPFRD